MIQSVTIIGVGLIGGSLARAWKSRSENLRITGLDRPDVLEAALATGVIDVGCERPDEAVAEADLVVIAAPVGAICPMLTTLAPLLSEGTVVTDVGSVKAPVMRHARSVLHPKNPFVGGHPMAGSAQSGVRSADPLLFENATYVLCPPAGLSSDAFLEQFSDLVTRIEQTGANVLLLDADRHDQIAAVVSHVPQLVAVALMNLAAGANEADSAFLRLAAGGFRDMTRIAASSFEVWEDILSANRIPIQNALEHLIASLRRDANHLRDSETGPFADQFRRAREARRAIPRDMKGFIHPLADAYVYGVDRPGFLFHLTRVVYEAGLNIKDIELLKMREGTGGAFRLGFSHEADANAAVETLNRNGYTAYRL